MRYALLTVLTLAAAPLGAAPPEGGAPVVSALAEDPETDFAAGRYDKAHAGYSEAVKARGADLALRHKVAVSAMLSGKEAAARAEALHVVARDPQASPASADVARIARALGDQRAEPTAPTLEAVEAALEEGRWRTAARLAREALDAPSTSSSARGAFFWARGRALTALGRGPEAWEALTLSAAMGAADVHLWRWLGELTGRAGQRALSRSFFDLSESLLPPDAPSRAPGGL